MVKAEFEAIDAENRSFTVESAEKLGKLLTELFQKGQVEGVGFDVFGTIINGSLNRSDLSALLSGKIADYYRSKTGKLMTDAECFGIYFEQREILKSKRNQILTKNGFLSAKDQECPEVLVFQEMAKLLELNESTDFISAIQAAWLDFDLQNTKPIFEMLDLVAQAISLFGKDHVGVYSNHSFTKMHLIAVLERSGYFGSSMLSSKNVFLSSEFGVREYGVGLRKPSVIAFNELSKQLLLSSAKLAFVGDNKNDSLFAVNAGGIGILI